MRSFDPTPFEALTFDCYGTLIDWHGGIRGAVAAMPSLAGIDVERLLEDRERLDFELIQADYLPYAEILRRSMRAAAQLQQFDAADEDLSAFAASMARWRPFEESVGCLERLAGRFRLCILSNVDTATLEASVAQLGVSFELVTAEQLRSYKPARAHFDAGLSRLGLGQGRVLHVAQSWIHDHATALELGWASAWVNRLNETLPTDGFAGEPSLTVTSLSELCENLNV